MHTWKKTGALLGIFAIIGAAITWYLIEEKKDFNRQKSEVLQAVEWNNASRVEIYRTLEKLKTLFQQEAQKGDQKNYNLHVFTTLRDEIIRSHPEFFYSHTKPYWKYYAGRQKPFEIQGPRTELNQEVETVDFKTLNQIYQIIGFEQNGKTIGETTKQIQELQTLFLNKTYSLDHIVYVRNEIMKHYSFYFQRDSTTKWSQNKNTGEFFMVGPFDIYGIEIKTP